MQRLVPEHRLSSLEAPAINMGLLQQLDELLAGLDRPAAIYCPRCTDDVDTDGTFLWCLNPWCGFADYLEYWEGL